MWKEFWKEHGDLLYTLIHFRIPEKDSRELRTAIFKRIVERLRKDEAKELSSLLEASRSSPMREITLKARLKSLLEWEITHYLTELLPEDPDRAWVHFHLLYEEMILRTLRKTLHEAAGTEEIEDIKQEIIADLFIRKGLSRFRGEATLKSWLIRIVLNRIGKWKGSQPTETHGLRLSKIPANQNGPGNELSKTEMGEIFQKCWENLPADLRLILELRFLEGKKWREIEASRIFGSVGSAEHRKNKALALLKACLEKNGYVPF